MSKVQHPVFPDVVKDVVDVEAWVRAGWRRVKPTVSLKRDKKQDVES